MTDFEYRLLIRIRDSRVTDDDYFTPEERNVLNSFTHKNRGWVHVSERGIYTVPRGGLIAISEHESVLEKENRERAQQAADAKAADEAADKRWRKDARRSWIQFWLNVLFSVIGFFAGVFAEYYFSILEALHLPIG